MVWINLPTYLPNKNLAIDEMINNSVEKKYVIFIYFPSIVLSQKVYDSKSIWKAFIVISLWKYKITSNNHIFTHISTHTHFNVTLKQAVYKLCSKVIVR